TCGMRTTKCQLLATSLCAMLLGLSIAALSTVTRFGPHFTLISNIAFESNSYKVIHNTAFYVGMCLSMILLLAALLSSIATVRESERLTAMGFFCFALAFCGLIPAAFWRYTHRTEVEDSMMDVYDFVYEEVRRNASSFRRQELAAIHETFLCCGKRSPFGETGHVERRTCPPGRPEAVEEDCLREIQDFLKKHMGFVSALLAVAICFVV
ncbi:TSN32 protein, partial [Nothoprocta ornata]|nr:TSN32 protein [Nothoprocta ornata]